jgi:hypothetical protein
MRGSNRLGAIFLVLLMCFTLGASVSFGMIEIDNQAVFSTEDMNYSFANGYNLTGTLTLTSGRLDIDNYYVFNISASGGDCNISIIQTTPSTLEWNSSCQAGVTRTDNFLGNYTHNQGLYINGTYDSTKTPSNYFVYFAYLNPTNENFVLNLTSGVQINVIWKNGTAVTDFNFFATNGSASLSGLNSSPIIYEGGFPLGMTNVSVNKTYSLVDDYGNLQFYTSSNSTIINNTGTGYIEQTLILYTAYVDIMGAELLWILLFLIDLVLIYYSYVTLNYGQGFMTSCLGICLGIILAIYSQGLPMIDPTTTTMMFGIGIFTTFFGLYEAVMNAWNVMFS